MGFFEGYKTAPADIRYIKSEEKNVLKDNKVALPVLGVFKSAGYENKGYQYGLVTEVEGEKCALTFTIGSVASRDSFFEAVGQYLGTKDTDPAFETPVVVMKQVGRSVILVDANAPETEG